MATPGTWLALLTGCMVLAGARAAGQAVESRPRLDSGRDSNSAAAYYYQGLSWLPQRPKDAAQAFEWASRLEPSWAEPYYARRVALLLNLPDHVLAEYFSRSRKVLRSRDVLAIDSLQVQAYLRNPLLSQRLDGMLMQEWFRRSTGNTASLVWFTRGDPLMLALLADAGGKFGEAAAGYRQVLKQNGDQHWVRFALAKSLVGASQLDSAAAELNELLRRLEVSDTADGSYVYESRSAYQHALALIHLGRGDTVASLTALGQALVEDVSRFPAHQLLGRLALARRDSANALTEFALAVELAPTDPAVRYERDSALYDLRHFSEAMEEFQAAIADDPWYAPPYFGAGYILENMGRFPEATNQYRRFLELAPRAEEAKREFARTHVQEIESLPGPDTAVSQ